MEDERNYYNNSSGGVLGNMFNRSCDGECGCCNSEILFFTIIFLLLFTSYGSILNN